MIDIVHFVARIMLAALLGGLIGWQRERVNRPAGFRTHVLVASGSALIMLISVHGFAEGGQVQDPARLAAQVVSGIGFLGAGTIMKEGLTVKGLTTAASLWVVAAIGLAAGVGFYIPALATTLLIYAALSSFTIFENRMRDHSVVHLCILADDRPGLLGEIGTVLGQLSVNIRNIAIHSLVGEKPGVRVDMEVRMPRHKSPSEMFARLAAIPGARQVDENTQ